MPHKRITLLNSPVDVLSMQETIDIIDKKIAGNEHIHHVVVNAAKLVNMQKDKVLYDSVVQCDIINADGQSVVWSSRFLRKPLPERVAGIDLMQNLVTLAHQKKYKIFFLGAREEIVSKVVKKYSTNFSPKIIAGYRNGYFNKADEPEIARQIAESGANMLFVAISSPKKEQFLYENREKLKSVNFIMGVGGSFDVVAGKTKRAPLWMQKSGLEWFHRFLQEPRRMWKRYLLTNTLFLYYVMKEKMKLSQNVCF